MESVTKAEFFATVGPLDVNPRVRMGTLRDRLHISDWEENHTRKKVGVSKMDAWGILPTEFFLAQQTAQN